MMAGEDRTLLLQLRTSTTEERRKAKQEGSLPPSSLSSAVPPPSSLFPCNGCESDGDGPASGVCPPLSQLLTVWIYLGHYLNHLFSCYPVEDFESIKLGPIFPVPSSVVSTLIAAVLLPVQDRQCSVVLGLRNCYEGGRVSQFF
jgi:hypothetical protein